MRPTPSTLPRSVIACLAGATLLNYVDRGNLATAAPLLQGELALSSAQIGLLLSSFFWTYAPGQLLAGWAVHRFPIRNVLAIGVAVWALATLATGFVSSFTGLLALRLLLGLGESVSFPGTQVLLTRHTQEQQRGTLMGLITMGQGIGPLFGILLGGLLMAQFGWRALFIVLGVITLLWVLPWLAATRSASMPVHVDEPHLQVSYAEVLSQRDFWGVAIGHFCANYGFYFILTWLPTYLIRTAGFSIAKMAAVGAVIYAIYSLSTALTGAFSDAWARRGASLTRVRKTLIISSLAGSSLVTAACAWVPPQTAVVLLCFAGVFFGLGTPMLFTIAGTLAGPRAAGRWLGAQNVAGQLAGILSPLVTGWVIDRTGGFGWAFVITAAVPALGILSWAFVLRRVEPLKWRADYGVATAWNDGTA